MFRIQNIPLLKELDFADERQSINISLRRSFFGLYCFQLISLPHRFKERLRLRLQRDAFCDDDG